MLDRNKQNPLDNIDKFKPVLDNGWKLFELNKEEARVTVQPMHACIQILLSEYGYMYFSPKYLTK